MKTRNTKIEVLRLVLMCFIFAWHLIVHGLDFEYVGKGVVEYSNINVMLFFCTLFVPATYCFVFISGYYGIKFSLEKLLNILSWCLLVSVGVVCFRLFFWHEQIGMKELYRSLFPITTNKWWFMSAFVLLYLLSPCLNLCKVYLNKNQFKILLILLFTFLQFRIFAFLPNAGSDVLGILFVYLLGQYMNKYKVITRKKAIYSYAFAFVTMFFVLVLINQLSLFLHKEGINKAIWIILGYSNPLIILMAISMFYLVYESSPYFNKRLNVLLSGNLFIYLLTDGTSLVNYKRIVSELENSLVYGGAFCLLIILGSLLVGYVVIKLSYYIIHRIVLSEKKLWFK